MLWEASRVWLATRIAEARNIELAPFEVGLNGSSNLGFSPAPNKFGRPVSDSSDLDFFIVNLELFEFVQLDISRFLLDVRPRLAAQRETLRRQVKRGLADVKNIPADHDAYPTSAMLRNESSIVIDKLRAEGHVAAPSSIRVYSSWRTLAKQLELNFSSLRASLKNAPEGHLPERR